MELNNFYNALGSVINNNFALVTVIFMIIIISMIGITAYAVMNDERNKYEERLMAKNELIGKLSEELAVTYKENYKMKEEIEKVSGKEIM